MNVHWVQQVTTLLPSMPFLNEIPQCTKREEKSASFTDTLASKETQRSKAAKVSYQSHNFCQFQSKAILLARRNAIFWSWERRNSQPRHIFLMRFLMLHEHFLAWKKLVSLLFYLFFPFFSKNFSSFTLGFLLWHICIL